MLTPGKGWPGHQLSHPHKTEKMALTTREWLHLPGEWGKEEAGGGRMDQESHLIEGGTAKVSEVRGMARNTNLKSEIRRQLLPERTVMLCLWLRRL